MANLPYAQTAGTLESMLGKIKTASVPEKFSPDFVSTKLMMKGGSARSIIPFIKKMGLASADGTPTERYKQYRNHNKMGQAIAESMYELYETLFEMNEYVYELEINDLKALIVEATGAELNSTVVKKVFATFQVLRNLADFNSVPETTSNNEQEEEQQEVAQIPQPIYQQSQQQTASTGEGINLSYTINLNLPATTDIEVFNAIFKSLKTHLLQE
jgi:hypothetical protein